MRVLIVRAKGDAEAAASALRARGHAVRAHPLIEIVDEDAALNLAAAQGFIVTDPDGAKALARAVGVRTFPVFCEGEASADELKRQAFTDVRNVNGDATAMAKAIERALSPKLGALIYACSTSAPINLSAMLNTMGFSVRMSALYTLKRPEALPGALAQELRAKAFDAAVFFTADEARAFAQLVVRAELDGTVKGMVAVVASPVVAAPLTVLKFARTVSAPHADTASVIGVVNDGLMPKPEPVVVAAPPPAPKPAPAPEPKPTPPPPPAPPAVANVELPSAPRPPPAVVVAPEPAKAAPAPPPPAPPPPIPPPSIPQGPTVMELLGTAVKDRWRRYRAERAAIAAQREAERPERERRAAERAAAARIEAERLAAERAEAARQAEERFRQERAEQARREVERRAAERAATERREQERLEQQRLDQERREAELREIERAEAERRQFTQQEWLRRESERAEKLRSELERGERERAEQARRDKEAAQRREQERQQRERERRAAEQQAAERRKQEDAERREKQATARREREDAKRLEKEKAARREKDLAEQRQKDEADRRQREEAERRQREETERREAEIRQAAQAESARREQERATSPHGAAEIELAPEPELAAVAAGVILTAPALLAPAQLDAAPPVSDGPDPVMAPAMAEAEMLPALAAADMGKDEAAQRAGKPGLIARLSGLVSRWRTRPRDPIAEGARKPSVQEPKTEPTPPAGATEIELPAESPVAAIEAANLAPLTADEKPGFAPPPTMTWAAVPSASPQEPSLPSAEMIPALEGSALPEPVTPPATASEPQPQPAPQPEPPPELPPERPPSVEIPLSPAASATESPPEELSPINVTAAQESMKEETPLVTMAPPAGTAADRDIASPPPEPMTPPDDHGQDQAKPAPARGGGRAARLLAEDAADARALNQRNRATGGEAEPSAPDTPANDAPIAPPAKKPSGAGRRFLAFVIAVIVVAGGILYSASWWAPQVRGLLQVLAPETAQPSAGAPTPATPDQVAAIEARATALAADVTALNARIVALEQRPAAGAGDAAMLTALGQRIAALEAQTRAPTTATPEGLGDSVVNQARQLTNVTARVATLEAAIGNVARLEDVATRLNALEGKSAEANSVLALAERIAALEQRDQVAATALVLATAQLREAVDAGRAYVIELETVTQLAARAGVAFNAEPLARHVATGAARVDVLRQGFAAMAAAVVRADALPSDASWWRRVIDRLLSVASIRPIGAPEGPSTGAVVARAETALARGDLGAAATELEALSGDAATAAQDWLAQARARVALDGAINELAARSVAAMGTASRSATVPGAPTP